MRFHFSLAVVAALLFGSIGRAQCANGVCAVPQPAHQRSYIYPAYSVAPIAVWREVQTTVQIREVRANRPGLIRRLFGARRGCR